MDSSIAGSDNAEMLSADKIKKEPGDVSVLSPGATTKVQVPASRVMTLITSGSKSGTTTTSGQKTILLVQAVNNKSGGMQSMMLPSSASSILSASKVSEVSVKKTTAVLLSSLLPPSMRGSTSKQSECILTPARSGGARTTATPSSYHAGSSSAKVSSAGASAMTPKMSNIDFQIPYALVFNSRTIQADGNVCALKEYLCNFCQFKVSNADEMEQHFSTHLFTCRFCSFRCISRLDALCHKRDNHLAAADELAGYEDLDRPTLLAKVNRLSRTPNTLLGNSSSGVPISVSSCRPVVKSMTSGGSLLSTASHTLTSPGNLSIKAPLSGKMVATNSTSSVVMGSSGKPGESYFAYRIVHDSDGKVQAYECDVCAYQSIRINDIFAHASTHSLAELTKSSNSGSSGASENLWECSYCSFTASQQVAVVGHVIAVHPNKPIQLKRMPSVSDQTSPDPNSGLLIPTGKPDVSAAKESGLASNAIAWSDKQGVQTDKKSKSEAGDQCIWGCYYCAMTSPSRNVIICHLKKEHSSEKLIVTRRRLARMASAASANETSKPEDKAAHHAEVPDKAPGKTVVKSEGKAKKKQRVTEADGTDVQIGDIDSTEAYQGSAKSRRKQVAPRKVAEESEDKIETTESSFQLSLASGISAVSEINGTQGPPDVVQDVKKTATVGGRKQGRSVSKYEGLIKKLKMAETEQSMEPFTSCLLKDRVRLTHVDSPVNEMLKNGTSPVSSAVIGTVTELQKKPSGKSPFSGVEGQKSKSSSARSSPAAGGTRALSLLTGQLVSGYVKPPSKNVDATGSDLGGELLKKDKPLEQHVEPEETAKKSGLKVGIVKVVGVTNKVKESELLLKFAYDSEVRSALCGVCGSTIHGQNALLQIQDHVAEHFNACKWKCVYCPFQSNDRIRIVGHVRRRHPDHPLRLERRSKLSAKSLSNKSTVSLEIDAAVQSSENLSGKRKLRGPRSIREEKFAQVSDTVWQCPFCSRRSLFQGFIKVHLQLAHPEVDILVPPQRWPRCHLSEDELKKRILASHVPIVRLEGSEDFEELDNIVETNARDLFRELDIDDEFESDALQQTLNDDADLLEFRCLQCHFRGANPAIVKCHILQSHHDADVTVLDMRTSRRMNHEHVFMCKSVDCQFMSTVQESFESHMRERPSHASNKVVSLQSPESRKVVRPNSSLETRSRSKVSTKPFTYSSASPPKRSSNHQLNIARAVNGPDAVREMASQYRRTADGDIEYNDDGTIQAADLTDDGYGSSCMQCHHCEYRCTALDDMRVHLRKSHALSEPLSIDVNAAIAGLHSWLFFCPVNSCDFVASYYNVYKHHMDVEHPDSDVGFPAKSRSNKRRSASSGGASINRRASSGGQDATYSASMRSSNRRSLVSDTQSESTNDSSRSDGAAVTDLSLSRYQALDSSIDATGFHYKPSNNRPYQSTKDKTSFDFSSRYECVLCTSAVATLADMKAHLLAAHDSSVVHQCIDRRARQLRKRQKVLFCPQSTCSYCCKFEEELEPHVKQEHPDSAAAIVGEDASKGDNSAYQCSFCTFITTDIEHAKQHVLAEHEEATDVAGFAKINTAFGAGGDLVMNVNDVDGDLAVSSDESDESTDHDQT